jgi:hypothetical protein
MAKIEVFLRQDMQNLGYLRLDEKGEPFYSYSELQATEMSVTDAIKLVNKLSNNYLFKIHRNKEEKEKQTKAHYILC